MKEVFLQTVGFQEIRVDPILPSKSNGYNHRVGSQSFNVEIEFVTNGQPISMQDFYNFIYEKIGKPGESFKIKNRN